MKQIGFVGAYDKTDFILYVAKILVEMGKKVILIDGTITQKAKYVVPTIKPSTTYMTEFEGIDVAVGFENFEDIREYLLLPDITSLETEYDYALLDVDTAKAVESWNIEKADKNYFVTSFDMYSLKKGIEALSGLREPIKATKILFSKNALKEEDDYLNFLSLGTKIVWEPEVIYLPFEVGDQTVIYNNQRVHKIKFKKLSNQYKVGLQYVAQKILEEQEYRLLTKAFKKIERGV